MADSLKSRIEIINKFGGMKQIMNRGRELKERGYKIHWHPTWGNSVEIPSTRECLSETQINIRYHEANNKEEIRGAYEYLVLYEEEFKHIPESRLGFIL